MHRASTVAVAVAVAVLVCCACGMFVEPPSDQEMTARFRRDRAAFESLLGAIQKAPAFGETLTREDLATPKLEPSAAKALQSALDGLAVRWIRGTGDAGFVFVTWVADIPGPGHRARGFAWAPRPPPGQPREEGRASFAEYKPLEGNWYLFEELVD